MTIKAKPVLKKVSEWVEIAKTNAKKLQIDIDLAIKQLEF